VPANAGMVRSGTTKTASKAFFMTFSWAGTFAAPLSSECAFGVLAVCIELTSALSGTIPR
jgi:hypothetical protein